jgi:hypothetical protein
VRRRGGAAGRRRSFAARFAISTASARSGRPGHPRGADRRRCGRSLE